MVKRKRWNARLASRVHRAGGEPHALLRGRLALPLKGYALELAAHVGLA
jgi:hypothetical protein